MPPDWSAFYAERAWHSHCAQVGCGHRSFPAAIVSNGIMTMPVHVTFRDLATNETLEALIRERAEALPHTYNRIVNCRVLVEVPHRHHRSGNRYQVRIELSVPGETLIVSHYPSLDPAVRLTGAAPSKAAELDADNRHAAMVIREAFDIARRRLQDFAERLNDKPHIRVPQ